MKIALYAFFLMVLSSSMVAQSAASPSEKDLVRVDAQPSRGFTYPYYLYAPPELKDSEAKAQLQTILVLPNNTGRPDDDFAVHEADVKKRMLMSEAIASQLKTAVLMPVFPRPKTDWRIYTHALDRDSMVTDDREYRRLDLQLLAMIDDARSRMNKQGLRFDKRVLISGFSAQGMFANRFTFLHPDRVKAAAIGSPGGWPMAPSETFGDKQLRYPIGVADLKTVSGKKLDLKKLRRVPMFIFTGDQDDNDSVPFDDSYDEADRQLIYPLFGKKPIDRWEIAKEIYSKAGLMADFKLYPGVAHTVTIAMRDDIRAFLMKYK